MRILFLSHYFPPEVNAPASRTYEHCKQWVKNGHQVTVVTCAPNHPGGKVYPGYKNKLYQWDKLDGIRVLRLWTYLAANEGFLKRTANYVSYMISAILAAPFIAKTDVVLSTSPQFFNGLAGYFVSRIKRSPWVLEIRDLWPESILAVGAITNKPVIRLLEYLESFAYRKADKIVPVTDAFARHIESRGVPAERIEVIKNGVDLSLFKVGERGTAPRKELGLDNKFVVSYFGTHGMAHGLHVVLQAADLLRNNPAIVFALVGDGAEKERLLKQRDEMGLNNVLMLDQQPKNRMPDFWSMSAISLVLLKKLDLFRTVIPSKIFESMAMETPIILGVEGESAEIIKEADCGICIEPENSLELANTVSMLFENKARREELGRNGREHVRNFYDRSVLARRYEAILESAIAVSAVVTSDETN